MNKNHIFKLLFLAVSIAMSLQMSAGNVGILTAQQIADSFIKKQVATGKFKANRATGITLAHAEKSAQIANANDFYAFNVNGGGWVIIAGEDRATPVLGYSDQGHLNFNALPCSFQALLDGYKQEIEFLQTYTGDDLVPVNPAPASSKAVEPLIKTTWGQETPYCLQCPIISKQYCVVGCVATAMAQVMYYWQYPQSCDVIPSYYCYDISQQLSSLPATTFDYSLMLESYCHWDWDNSVLVQDTYTMAQAQEVAKLSRYCGQAVEMGYSPEGSGAYVSDQLYAMKNYFDYRSTAQDVSKSSWYGNSYTTSQWEAMIKVELDAGRPILYSASDPSAGGHAFICDGYNSEGKFHFNFGWYGTCDGWYVSTALNMIHREGDELHFNSNHEMLIGVEPPEGWEPPAQWRIGDLNKDGNVDIDDMNILINIILETDKAENYDGRADLTNDGDVDIDDINEIINIILTT